jgi:hypothetical protein
MENNLPNEEEKPKPVSHGNPFDKLMASAEKIIERAKPSIERHAKNAEKIVEAHFGKSKPTKEKK